MQNKTLLAIGEALIDFIPAEAGCDFARVSSFSPKVGGAPANVCGAYARLGGKAALLSQLGDDPFGHKIAGELAGYGVDMSRVPFTKSAHTGLAFVSLAADGDRTFSFYRDPSADMLYSPEQLRADWFREAFALHFCSVSLGAFPMKEAHRQAIRYARQAGALVSFDVNLRFPLWPDRQALYRAVWDFLPLADVVKLSDEELPFLTGTASIGEALPRLFRGRVRLVLYTCGSRGAWAFTPTARAFMPSLSVQAVDTTGAGDGFIGAFLWQLARRGLSVPALARLDEKALTDCLAFAHRFCAFSVQKPGAIASYPTLQQMESAL